MLSGENPPGGSEACELLTARGPWAGDHTITSLAVQGVARLDDSTPGVRIRGSNNASRFLLRPKITSQVPASGRYRSLVDSIMSIG